MMNWREVVENAATQNPRAGLFDDRFVLPIGYESDDNVATMAFGLYEDVHGLVVGAQNTGKHTLVEAMCKAAKDMYKDSLDVTIYDIREAPGKFERSETIGSGVTWTRITTDNEFEFMIESILAEVQERYRVLNLVGCKNCCTWNRKLESMIGQEMSDEDKFCFVPHTGQDVWNAGHAIKQKVYVLQNVLDYIHTLSVGKLSSFEKVITTVIKMSRCVGVHLILTGYSVRMLKADILANVTARVVFNTDNKVDQRMLSIVNYRNLDRYEVRVQSSRDDGYWRIARIPMIEKE